MGCDGERRGEGEASPAQSSSVSVCVVTTRSVRSSLISCLCAHCALLHGKLRYCDTAEKVLAGQKCQHCHVNPPRGGPRVHPSAGNIPCSGNSFKLKHLRKAAANYLGLVCVAAAFSRRSPRRGKPSPALRGRAAIEPIQ